MRSSALKKFILIVLIFSGCRIFSQHVRFDFPKGDLQKTARIHVNSPLSPMKPKFPETLTITYYPPKLAFFCNMEDKLHKRFNVWFVLRAGSDEQYRKLLTKEK